MGVAMWGLIIVKPMVADALIAANTTETQAAALTNAFLTSQTFQVKISSFSFRLDPKSFVNELGPEKSSNANYSIKSPLRSALMLRSDLNHEKSFLALFVSFVRTKKRLRVVVLFFC